MRDIPADSSSSAGDVNGLGIGHAPDGLSRYTALLEQAHGVVVACRMQQLHYRMMHSHSRNEQSRTGAAAVRIEELRHRLGEARGGCDASIESSSLRAGRQGRNPLVVRTTSPLSIPSGLPSLDEPSNVGVAFYAAEETPSRGVLP